MSTKFRIWLAIIAIALVAVSCGTDVGDSEASRTASDSFESDVSTDDSPSVTEAAEEELDVAPIDDTSDESDELEVEDTDEEPSEDVEPVEDTDPVEDETASQEADADSADENVVEQTPEAEVAETADSSSDSVEDEAGEVVEATDEEQEDETTQTTTTAPAVVTTQASIEDAENIESAPVNEQGEEPGSGTPDFDEALEEVSLNGPCDLFSDSELDGVLTTAGNSSGLFDELPTGIGGGPLSFYTSSESETSCEWFSDSYIWFVGVSWEAADPTFVDTAFGDSPTFGDGYTASLLTDTSAQMVVADLLIRVTNLVPGNAETASDREVTEAVVAAIGEQLGG